MQTRLMAGESAVVTGAGSGIGRGIARALAGEGARVFLSDIDTAAGEAVAQGLRAEGADARFFAADLAAAEGQRALLRAAAAALGTVSILVHSASPRRREVDDIFSVSDETWTRCWR
jgi:3-oxoacyl-[acyl-carrier protein] reductase